MRRFASLQFKLPYDSESKMSIAHERLLGVSVPIRYTSASFPIARRYLKRAGQPAKGEYQSK